FQNKKMPTWGPDLSAIDFGNITYYLKPGEHEQKRWEDVPPEIKRTFDKLGIPEAERKFLGGVGAQYESEVVYHSLKKELEDQGVIFCDPDTAFQKHEDIFRPYFGKTVPPGDNKFAALNSAVFSGGSFIYVPKGVEVKLPLQAYFRINEKNIGQFERTLIIVDEGAKVHYIEGCSAPMYSSDSLHSAVVEIIAKKNAHVQYTTIQNWSSNVYNLVTKRAFAYGNSRVYWVDANIGSKITMKYPSVYMLEPGASADILSVAFAGAGQIQDAGGKAVHLAPNTSSHIVSKSVSKNSGRTSYRGLVRVAKGAKNSTTSVRCDALMLDELSRSDTYPYITIEEEDVTVSHEASVGKLSEDQLFYLRSRGLNEEDAKTMIILGFISEFVKELPMEYAIEMNRLIRLEMENAVG
ncbi:Fe-S cluster assembly protein SufB, partial [Candidatus Micrarchaeota archaeon]|nr:Fe-S cluster assembly protein SufB [Candidatus Micrarchaeota archaeon]